MIKCFKCGEPITKPNLYIVINNKKKYFHVNCISCDELQLYLSSNKEIINEPSNNNIPLSYF